MKTGNSISITRTASLALGLAALLALPSYGVAQVKGAEKLLKLNRIQSPADVQQVQAGDRVVMSCPKCKDIWVKTVEPTFKATHPKETHLVREHQCPGCGSQKVIQGHGKTKTTTLVHVCTACGSQDANCCVMRKGGEPTPGMP